MRRVPPAALAALLLVSGPAVADDDDATVDLPTRLAAHLDGTNVVVGARYAFDVSGPSFSEQQTLTLPHRGVVTGAIAIVDGKPHRLGLLAADRADKVFQVLAETPGGAQRRWVVSIQQSSSGDASVAVDIASPHAARLQVELELAVPTCFDRDVRYIAVPSNWARVAAKANAPHRKAEDLDAACDTDMMLGDHVWLAFPTTELSTQPFGDQRIGTHAQRLDLDAQHMAHVELSVASTLSQVPADLATVFVVDASRSVTGNQLVGQQAIVASYLDHAPRSRVQVIAYARRPRALLAGWSIASLAKSRIERELGQLATANGSNIDEAIRAAGQWLSRVQGTKRIVVFTDELLATRFDAAAPAALERELPDGTLVHVVALDESGSMQRDDEVTFGKLAVATEGIGVRAGVDGSDTKLDALELVRPIALDNAVLKTAGWTTLDIDTMHGCSTKDGARIAEGAGCTWFGSSVTGIGMITLDALAWNHHVTRIVRPDPGGARDLARVLSVATGGNFAAEVMTQIQRAALAVNPVWTLIGSWGGNDGYADIGVDSSGWGTSGCGCGGGGSSDSIGIGSFGTMGSRLNLDQVIAAGVERCHVGTTKVKIDLELTLSEIVDVHVTTSDAALRECVTEAVWDTDVIVTTNQRHASTTVVLGG